MSRRLSRVEEACREVIAQVIQREVKDPRVGFVTVTGVRLSPDLRHARIYVSIMGDPDEVARSMAGLESARGYMRAALGRRLRIKNLPEITFELDHATEESLHLAGLLRRVEEELEETTDGHDGAD